MAEVLIVEPNQSLTIQLRQYCQAYPGLNLVATESSLDRVLQALEHQTIDVVILAQTLPGNIFQIAQTLRDRAPTLKILILGVDPEHTGLLQAIHAGANGYLPHDSTPADLVKAVQGAMKGYFQSLSRTSVPSLNGFNAERFDITGKLQPVDHNNHSPLSLSSPTELKTLQTGFSEFTPVTDPQVLQRSFEQTVLLKPSPIWSRLMTWLLLGLSVGLFAWANFFKLEEAIPAQGQLEPEGAVREVQAPIAGVVQALYVKDGQTVKQGDMLLRLDRKVNQAQLKALQKIRAKLVLENQFYQQQLNPRRAINSSPEGIPAQIFSLTRSRQNLVADNQFYRTQIQGGSGDRLSPDQRLRLLSNRQQEQSQLNSVTYEIEKLHKELDQAEIQLTGAQEILTVNQGILADIEPVQQQGAISKVQYLRQYQEVQKGLAEVKRLEEEKKRVVAQIDKAQEQKVMIRSSTLTDLTAKLEENEQKIADIDSQLTKAIVENQKQIVDLENRINQTNTQLQYQEIQAPASGIIFDLKPKASGFVTNVSDTLLKIVPSDALIAKIYIPNRDIGFVKVNMLADVRVDAFPFNEFGDIKGKLIWLGSDVLPPTDTRRFYSFPATIKLDSQRLYAQGRSLSLQSGMSVTVNLKTRQRSIMTVFTEFFAQQADGFKHMR